MSMFERAAAAWKIQSEEERTVRTKQDHKQTARGIREAVEGDHRADAFKVRGAGEQLSAEIEGVVFVSDMTLHRIIVCFSGMWIVTNKANGTQMISGLNHTTGDLGRELERLKNDRSVLPKRANDRHENETQNSVAQAL